VISPRLIAAAAASVSVLMLGGCVSLLPKAKPAELYRFGILDAAPTPPVTIVRNVILEPVVFPREAMGDGILTVEGQNTAYITGARWVAPAGVLFREALDHAFTQAAPGARLLSQGETGAASANLQLNVMRFEADYTTPKGAPTIRIGLRARLNKADGAPIDAMLFNVEKPAAANRVTAIVQAYDAAVDETLTALAQWVDQRTPPPVVPVSTSLVTSTKSTTTSTTSRRP